jgi:hypothetical protein
MSKDKHLTNKDKSRESIHKILVNNSHVIGTLKHRSGSKTPKSGHTWLIRDNRPSEVDRAIHSKSKL